MMNDFDLTSDSVLLIGDRLIDYHEAEEAGIKNIILVEYGWGYDRSKIPKQEVPVNEPKDLLRAVYRLEEKMKTQNSTCNPIA
jgi:phosphoglycolate phosphatase